MTAKQNQAKKDVTRLVEEGALLEALTIALNGGLNLTWANRVIALIIETGDTSQMSQCLTIALSNMPNTVTHSIIQALPKYEDDGGFIGGPNDPVTIERLAIQKELEAARNESPLSRKEQNKAVREMMKKKQYSKAQAFMNRHGLDTPKNYQKPTSGYALYLKRRALDQKQERRALAYA